MVKYTKECESMKGYITSKQEWIYKDTQIDALPKAISLSIAKNGLRGLQCIVESTDKTVEVSVCGDVTAEVFQMIEIPVEYNTISDEGQGGEFVMMDYSLPKPSYCTRKAPFDVYDCLKLTNGIIPVIENRAVFYVTLAPNGLLANTNVTLKIKTNSEMHECAINLKVYDVEIPSEKFKVTNWFHLENIAKYHHVEYGSKEHLDMIRKYAQAMRRVRQTHFFISVDKRCIVDKENWMFNFDYLKPIIEIFFEEGFSTMEFGGIATRTPNLLGPDFNFTLDDSINLDSDAGYLVLNKYLKAIAKFLNENNWNEKVVIHISDEPDVHTDDDSILQQRRKVYYMIASQLRKHIPNCSIIEAVKGAMFRGGIDILVPLTVNYEKEKKTFDMLVENGEEVWCYVCCSPGGNYLNRFLDFDLIKNRLLFWGCSANKLSGFLHWGFNMYQNDVDPFKQSSCHNSTGLGTNFPCGDSHIVYPGENEPWISMRLESQRQGAEDCELLNLLREKDFSTYQRLVKNVFRSNNDYNSDADDFEQSYDELLMTLSK